MGKLLSEILLVVAAKEDAHQSDLIEVVYIQNREGGWRRWLDVGLYARFLSDTTSI